MGILLKIRTLREVTVTSCMSQVDMLASHPTQGDLVGFLIVIISVLVIAFIKGSNI